MSRATQGEQDNYEMHVRAANIVSVQGGRHPCRGCGWSPAQREENKGISQENALVGSGRRPRQTGGHVQRKSAILVTGGHPKVCYEWKGKRLNESCVKLSPSGCCKENPVGQCLCSGDKQGVLPNL